MGRKLARRSSSRNMGRKLARRSSKVRKARKAKKPKRAKGMKGKKKGKKGKKINEVKEFKTMDEVYSGEPLERGYSLVMYAPTSRAACKGCGCLIDQGEPKVGNRVPSPWHHGLDTLWKCAGCGYGRVRRISQLRNWDRLKYEDQRNIRKFTGELFSPEDEEKLQNAMAPLEEIEDLVMYNMKKKQMVETLMLNGINPMRLNFCKKLDKMGKMIADQMLNGVAEPCRTCKKQTVMTHGYRLRCIGYMQSGFTRCTFVTNPGDLHTQRYAMLIPDSLATKSWLSEWSLRNDHAMIVANPPKDSITPAGDEDEKQETKKENKQAAKQTAEQTAAKRKHSLEVLCLYEEELKKLSEKDLVKVLKSGAGEARSKTASKEELIDACIAAYRADKDLMHTELLLLTVPLIKMNFTVRGFDVPKKNISKAKLAKLFRAKINKEFASLKVETESVKPRKKKIKKTIGKPLKGSRGDQEKRKFVERYRDIPQNPRLGESDTKRQSKKKRKKLQPPEEGSSILQLALTFIEHVSPVGSIFVDPCNGVDVYNATLTKVNLRTGYNNFYRLQLIESRGIFFVFRRWGETGNDGGSSYKYNTEYCNHRFQTSKEAMKYFKKVFKEKSGNEFEDRYDFVQRPNFYNYVPLSRVNHKKPRRISGRLSASGADIPSLLPKRTKELVDWIFDEKHAKDTLRDENINLDKMPLGAVTRERMLMGYSILKELEEHLKVKPAKMLKQEYREWKAVLVDLSTRYYNTIPQTSPMVIKSLRKLKKQSELLDALMGVQATLAVTRRKKGRSDMNPSDQNYASLKCKLKQLPESGDVWNLVDKYLQNTHGKTHSHYTLELDELYEVDRQGEQQRFTPHASNENRMLLWHGSRLMNYVGILSQGMRIAPPEAPVSGYMFGKGVYFADMCSKSSNYCMVSPDSKDNAGLLLLCEVALGEMDKKLRADSNAANLPEGKQSVMGCGCNFPNEEGLLTLPSGVKVPCGKAESHPQAVGGALLYNEYIVYDEAQVLIRYLVKCRFKFKE